MPFPAKHAKHAEKAYITPDTWGRNVRKAVRPAFVWKAMLSAGVLPDGFARHFVPRRCQAARTVFCPCR